MNKFTVRPNKSVSDIIEVSSIHIFNQKALDRPVELVCVSQRACKGLRSNGVNTVKDLISRSFSELQAMPGVGKKAEEDIVLYVIRKNLNTEKMQPIGKRYGFLEAMRRLQAQGFKLEINY